ncbi:hypothetical protein EUGRSUZ_I00809 [Eucalyptus grandis]|uniref:Uncharacterized protein n=2 Tax=Eucalyptus grandis TaxID=71139 RepID=A0A059AM69_EUCGR|nr:hypothetical protein EUGRSUZ_I00809 [Eucalyptus grandis]
MVAVSSKELLTYYLITLQLGETVQSGLPKRSASTASTESINIRHQRQQSQDHQLHDLQQEPSEGKDVPKGEPRPPKSEWVVYIKELQRAHEDDVAWARAKPSIYQIPSYLKDAEKDAYVPQIVSLGPYHHGDKRLSQMEQHKWRCLRHILERTNHRMDYYLGSVKAVEERARTCYDEKFPSMSSEEFVKMMVLDGCFVIELFQGVKGGFKALGYPRDDPVFSSMGGLMHRIQQDMIMLENQIPLFILDRLLGLQHGNPNQKGLVAKRAVRFFEPLMQTDEHSRTRLKYDPLFYEGGLHCLEVYRRSLLRLGTMPEARTWTKRGSRRRQQHIRSVVELREAGINFKQRKTDRFWDIKFKCGTLRIPRLRIHSGTRSLFLNLIAFEQSHFDCSNAISSYVTFMDNLINSPEDVGYLHYCGIIEHWLGSDAEVADLFNRLCQEVAFNINDSYLSELSADLNKYYSLKWNNWRASLKHNYFNNPWTIISVMAAFVLLVLTFTQTFYGVYGYYKPGF